MKLQQNLVLISRIAVIAVFGMVTIQSQADTKQDLIKSLPSLQKAELDALAADLTQNPVRQLMGQAQSVLIQAVPAEKREATAKQITAELTKFVNSATPLMQASANKVAAQAITPVMSNKFTEEELKQLSTMLNSPIIKKYQEVLPDINQALFEKISSDATPQIDPKLKALQQSIRNILDTASGGKLTQAAAEQAKAAQKNKAAAPKK